MKASLSAAQIFVIFIFAFVVAFLLSPGVIVSLPAGDSGAIYQGYWFHTETTRYFNSLFHAVIIAALITLVVYIVTITMNSYEPGYDSKDRTLSNSAPPPGSYTFGPPQNYGSGSLTGSFTGSLPPPGGGGGF